MPEFMTRLERYGFKIPANYFLASGEAAVKKAS
jgi:hypothetical protein